jgi:hypothetical protein
MKTFFSALALAFSALTATAQTVAEPQFQNSCDERNWSRNGDGNKQFCETRDMALPAPVGQPLTIDGGANGGISVHGWSGPNVRVRAKVTSWASTEAAAQSRVKNLTISSANNTLRATSTDKDEQYSVSYEVFVPRQTALALSTNNGGISLDNLQSDVRFKAVNGGVTLASMGGQVSGRTVNGGLNIVLTGSQWDGKGLDVETTNGGINWKLPREYSAQLFTSTNMGSIRADFPVTRTGFLNKELATSLGKGGATVKAVTSNGGINVLREGRD